MRRIAEGKSGTACRLLVKSDDMSQAFCNPLPLFVAVLLVLTPVADACGGTCCRTGSDGMPSERRSATSGSSHREGCATEFTECLFNGAPHADHAGSGGDCCEHLPCGHLPIPAVASEAATQSEHSSTGLPTSAVRLPA